MLVVSSYFSTLLIIGLDCGLVLANGLWVEVTEPVPRRNLKSHCVFLSCFLQFSVSTNLYFRWGVFLHSQSHSGWDMKNGAGQSSAELGLTSKSHETWARNKPLLLKAWGLGLLLKHDSTILTQTQCSGLSNNKFSFEQWDILDILFIGFEESSGWCFLWHIHAPWCYLSDLSSSPIALESSFQITLVLDDVFFLTLLFLTLFSL